MPRLDRRPGRAPRRSDLPAALHAAAAAQRLVAAECHDRRTSVAEGRMHAAEIEQVARAKADGRSQTAYAGSASIEVLLPDLVQALTAEPKAQAMFERLSHQNRYAILYRIATAKRADTRARRIQQFVTMLARGETSTLRRTSESQPDVSP